MGVIYKATNKVNKKAYIGQTKRPFLKRKREHELAAQNNKDNFAIHAALRKYGLDNFEWEILEECEDEILNNREVYWIQYYDTYNNGYNMTLGGDNLNSNAIKEWMQEHPEQWQANLEKGRGFLKKTDPDKFEEIRQKGTDSSKVKVRCIELDIIFDSISDAARWSKTLNNPNKREIKISSISRVCRGGRKTTGGYHWEYVVVI